MGDVEERGAAGVSRRQAIASGVAALGAALGVPSVALSALADGQTQVAYQLKFFLKITPPRLLQTIDVPAPVAYEYAHGYGPMGVTLHRIGDTVTFPFPPTIVQGKIPSVAGEAVPGSKYEVRFFSAKQRLTASVDPNVACLLDREGWRLDIRFFINREEAPLVLPANMIQGKCLL